MPKESLKVGQVIFPQIIVCLGSLDHFRPNYLLLQNKNVSDSGENPDLWARLRAIAGRRAAMCAAMETLFDIGMMSGEGQSSSSDAATNTSKFAANFQRAQAQPLYQDELRAVTARYQGLSEKALKLLAYANCMEAIIGQVDHPVDL